MGSNIHSLVLADWSLDGSWERLDYPLWPDARFNPKKIVEFGNTSFTNEPFSVRYYPLYGALAGHRSVDASLIHTLRGLHAPLTSEDKIGDRTWGELKKHSWATFAELDRFMTQTQFGSFGARETDPQVVAYLAQALTPLRTIHERGIPLVYVFAFDN